MQFHQTTLPNGLEIVAETKPSAHSTAIGFFVRTGARDETVAVSGVSHFLEHMAFKGNGRFTADDVNRIFDEVGANYNASTSEELTFYYAAILPEYLENTFEVLSALIQPSLREDDFEMEKQVILEEIGMYEDMPGFAVYDHSMAIHFAKHPLGQSILGSQDSVSALTSEQMRNYHAARYGAQNVVLIATGNVDWEQLQKLAVSYCGDWLPGTPGRQVSEAVPEPQSVWIEKPLNQQHVMQMAPAPPAQSPLRFAAEIISLIVGDDSTGRLYWELIETGLAESADLSYNDYDGSGAWSTYLCCLPETTRDNLNKIHEIYEEFNAQGPTELEFQRAKNKVAARIVLASERPIGRLSAVGNNWIYQRTYRSVQDELDLLTGLSLTDIRETLDRYPLAQSTTVGLGPFKE